MFEYKAYGIWFAPDQTIIEYSCCGVFFGVQQQLVELKPLKVEEIFTEIVLEILNTFFVQEYTKYFEI